MAETLGQLYSCKRGVLLKVMEEFNIQGKQTSFYNYCPGTFEYTLVEHTEPKGVRPKMREC